MKSGSSHVFLLVRLAVCALCLFTAAARADDYADVAQLVRAGKLPEALARVDQALQAHPKDPQLRFFKGVIQRDAGKTGDAINTFTRLSEDYPELPEPFNNLAVLYAGQGQYDKARTALEMAIRTNPSYSIAHENLGDVYAKLASQAYNRALQLDTANASVGPKLALIRELFVPSGRLQRASATVPPAPPTTPPPAPAPVLAAAPTSSAAARSPAVPAPAKAPAAAVAATPASAHPAAAVAAVPPPPAKTTNQPAPVPAAPAAPALAKAPVAKPAAVPAAPAAASDREIDAAVKAWASAWAARDLKTYLGSYAKDFATPGGVSRSSWEDERRKRIVGKSNISVRLSNVVISSSGNKATVKFRQDYKAGGLAVSSRKLLELARNGNRWQITREAVVD